jgi:PEGA domain-containing protein
VGTWTHAGLLALVVVGTPAWARAQPPAPAVDERAELDAGDQSTRAKDFAGALDHYSRAMRASPSARAQLGIAGALEQLGRLGEAYQAYDEAERTWQAKLSPADKALASQRLKALAPKTGWLSIHASDAGTGAASSGAPGGSELVGAEIAVDGRVVGTSPTLARVRVAAGPHDVRVTRDGFAPFTAHVEIAADGKAAVDAVLARQATRGHLVVHVTGAGAVRVLVDDVDVGAAPWEGDVPPGAHAVAARSSTADAPPQRVDVAAGAIATVDLTATSVAAHLQVRTSDGKGSVYVDGADAGEGTYSADVVAGPHTVVVTRAGFQRVEKTITLDERQAWSEVVTLLPIDTSAPAPVAGVAADRPIEGTYGGLGLLGAFAVGGQGTNLENSCQTLGAASCDTPAGYGAAVFGYFGWTFDPVGFELFLATSADTVQQTAHFDGGSASNDSPYASPKRDEKFTFGRFGGLAALRARAVVQNKTVRGTAAIGLGFSYKYMLMRREAAATASDGSNLTNKYVPDGVSYVAPALSAEAAVEWRLSPRMALALGVELWVENASTFGDASSPVQTGTQLTGGAGVQPVSINTPQYHFATGPQTMVGPFLGVQFGP